MEPPSKPVLIYDGECRFCRHFVGRWKRRTGDRVRYETRESARAWVLEEFYRRSAGAVLLMMPDGRFFEGAEAVFKVRALGGLGLGLWLFEHLPGGRRISDAAYRLVARNRMFFSWMLRVGTRLAAPAKDWEGVRWLVLRGLAVIYAAAFLSLVLQVRGLAGEKGLLPAGPFLEAVWKNLGWESLWRLPTLCWINASDGFLLFLGWGGFGLSFLLLAGLAPGWAALLLWIFFLSLANVCGDFLSFQWDALLCEAGFLAIFLAPWCWRKREGKDPASSLVVVWLFRLLAARFMFTCGWVKWAGGDPVWRDLTALNYHYFTQPLPTWVGWYANQLPEWGQKLSTGIMFSIELALPFFILFGRRGRMAAFAGFVLLQFAILLTGNHAYFNWLTLVLCLSLLDDRILGRIKVPAGRGPANETPSLFRAAGTGLAALLVLFLTVWGGGIRWLGWGRMPRLAEEINGGWRLVNSYGVFAHMTTRRPELIVEGSEDGVVWKAYGFKYKPGDLRRRPAFVAPFQPRLDWQMWFMGVGTMGHPHVPDWFANFLKQLLSGGPEVLGLLEEDPFAGRKPRYVRVKLYDYEFTNTEERKQTGNWWKREYRGLLVPEIGMDKFR